MPDHKKSVNESEPDLSIATQLRLIRESLARLEASLMLRNRRLFRIERALKIQPELDDEEALAGLEQHLQQDADQLKEDIDLGVKLPGMRSTVRTAEERPEYKAPSVSSAATSVDSPSAPDDFQQKINESIEEKNELNLEQSLEQIQQAIKEEDNLPDDIDQALQQAIMLSLNSERSQISAKNNLSGGFTREQIMGETRPKLPPRTFKRNAKGKLVKKFKESWPD